MGPLTEKLKNRWFGKNQEPEKRFFRLVMLLGLALMVLMIMAGTVVFFLSLETVEDTTVPDVRGLDLANAVIELEEKALFPSVQLRYSDSADEKGTVLEQEPRPGKNVKAGSRIVVRVSKGVPVKKLEDFTGWSLLDLKTHLRNLQSIYGTLVDVEEPVVRIYDDSPAGTILEQKPQAGTELYEMTPLELVVSKGPYGQTREVLNYVGLTYNEVIASVVKTSIPFIFTARAAETGEKPGYVVEQSPDHETEVPLDTVMQFVIARPEDVPDGEVFGIFERTLPEYPVPVLLRVEIVSPEGESRLLFQTRHKGGLITVPFQEPENSLINIIIGDKETISYRVRREM